MPSRARSVTVVACAWLAAFMVFVLFLGPLASAASEPQAGTAISPWAYGGQGWSNETLTIGNTTLTWNGAFGWTVIFTVTHTAPDVWMVEEERTVGITITERFSGLIRQGTYHYNALVTDVAFANVTNQSEVYVGGTAVPALGMLNASMTEAGSITESIAETVAAYSRSASLDVKGTADATVSFSPSFGLFPLNLTDVSEWNSTTMATASGHWGLSWNWDEVDFNGTTGSGANGDSGTLSGSAPLNLTGQKVAILHPFVDHKTRVGVVLVIQGPFDVYDGFILVPHVFDVIGSATPPYDTLELGSAVISTETLALSSGPGGLAITAADQTFTSADSTVNSQATTVADATPAPSSPAATVEGQPMSVDEAQKVDQQLSGASASAASSSISTLLLGVVVVVVVSVTLAVVLVTERRRMPPPVYPNAGLYPPGPSAGGPYRPSARPSERPPQPAEEDPLDNLW